MLKNLKLANKMLFSFGLVAIVTLVVGLLGVYSSTILTDALNYMGKNRVTDLRSLSGLNYERMIIRAQTLEVSLTREKNDRQAALRAIKEQRTASWQRTDKNWEQLQTIPRNTDKGKQLLANLRERYTAWRGIYVELDKTIDTLIASTNNEQEIAYKNYRELVQRMIPLSEAYGQTLDELVILFRFQDVTNPGPVGQTADSCFVCRHFCQPKFCLGSCGIKRVENTVGEIVSAQDIPDLFRRI